MTTFARIDVGQRFRLQRRPHTEYIKVDGGALDSTGNIRTLGQNTKVILPPYDNATNGDRPRHSVRIDGKNLPFNVSPFMARQLQELSNNGYGILPEVIRTALSAWRETLQLGTGGSDMQALCEFTGLRPQEVIELAVYDLWSK